MRLPQPRCLQLPATAGAGPAADERDAYYEALLTTRPAEYGLASETIAEVWAETR